MEKNNFEVFLVNSSSEAKDLVLNVIIPQLDPKIITQGGSMTFGSTELGPILMDDPRFIIINPYESGITPADAYERRRQSLLSDIYFAGSNALTEDGKLVNLDGVGNRIGGINFGPKMQCSSSVATRLFPMWSRLWFGSRILQHRLTQCA